MAINTFLPKVFAARASHSFFYEPQWMSVVADRTTEVTMPATQLITPNFETNVSVFDYTADTDMTTEDTLDDSENIINFTEKKATRVYVDDLHVYQNFGGLLSESALYAMRKIRTTLNTYLRTQFAAGLPNSQIHDYSIPAAEWGKPAGRAKLVEAFFDLQSVADIAAFTPVRFMGVHPDIIRELRKYLVIDKPNLGAGAMVDSTFMGAPVLQVAGWELIPDKDFTYDATAANQPIGYAGVPGVTLEAVFQARSAETQRAINRFGTYVKTLWVYGAARSLDSKALALRVDFA